MVEEEQEQISQSVQENLEVQDSISEPSEEELRRLAFSDELTGLKNRRFLRNRVPLFINMASKRSGSVTLAMLDLDGFKSVNDTYGHMAGDTLLQFFAEAISERVGDKGIPIRFAGDEFTVVFRDHSKAQAKAILDGLIERLSDSPIDVGDNNEVVIGVSIGIANYPIDARDYENLFKRADEALYHAKDSGKNRTVVYPDEGKLVAVGNISTLFPVDKTVGFEEFLNSLKLLTVDRIIGENSVPELPVIFGPRGSGKTRILNELRKIAEQMGHGVIFAAGQPESSRPYIALIKAFGEKLRRDPVLLTEIAGEFTFEEKKELTKNIPELAELPDPPGEDFNGTGRTGRAGENVDTLIFKALNKILFGILRKGRQLIVIDNAQSVDTTSLGFLDSFMTEFPQSEIDLVFAINASSESEFENNMMHFLGGMARTAQIAEITRLKIPPLTAKDIAGMLYEITGRIDYPMENLDILTERSGGNPLFIEELLKLLIERGLIEYDGADWITKSFSSEDLPKSLSELLSERAEKLSEDDKKILKQAAAIGETFDIKLLSKLAEVDEHVALDALERSRQADIIHEVPGEEADFSFNSESTRKTFYSLWDEQERKNVHLDIAELEIELNPGREDEVIGKLAHHFQQAERWDKAAELIMQSRERVAQARIPEATRRMLQRRAFIDDMAKESTLEMEDIGRAIKAFRNVKVSIQALRLYPRENENVEKAITRAFDGISGFFSKTEALTFSITREAILVNGQMPGPEQADPHLANEFYNLLNPYNLQGIVLIRGLTKIELDDFLVIFKEKPENVVDGWDQIIEEKKLQHTKPNHKTHIAMGERKVILGGDSVVVETPEKTGDSASVELTRQALDNIKSLIDDFKEESAELVKTMREGGASENSTEKLLAVLQNLSGYIPAEERAPAGSPVGGAAETKGEKQPVAEAGEPKKEPIETEFGEISEISRKEFKDSSIFGELSPIQNWIADLSSTDKLTKARAAQNLVKAGEKAIDSCQKAIVSSEDSNLIRLLAMILQKIEPQGREAFTKTLESDRETVSICKFVSVADVFKDVPAVQERIASLLTHPAVSVREATIEAMSRFSQDVVNSAAKSAFGSDENSIRMTAAYAIGRLHLSALLPDLLGNCTRDSLLKKLPDTAFGLVSIRALGNFDTPEVYETLVSISKSAGFFGKNLPDNLRLESVRALGRLGTDAAKRALKIIAKSGGKNVGGMAKSLL